MNKRNATNHHAVESIHDYLDSPLPSFDDNEHIEDVDAKPMSQEEIESDWRRFEILRAAFCEDGIDPQPPVQRDLQDRQKTRIRWPLFGVAATLACLLLPVAVHIGRPYYALSQISSLQEEFGRDEYRPATQSNHSQTDPENVPSRVQTYVVIAQGRLTTLPESAQRFVSVICSDPQRGHLKREQLAAVQIELISSKYSKVRGDAVIALSGINVNSEEVFAVLLEFVKNKKHSLENRMNAFETLEELAATSGVRFLQRLIETRDELRAGSVDEQELLETIDEILQPHISRIRDN